MSENLKLKKVNKSFVPEPRKLSMFRVFSDSYMRMNDVNVFRIHMNMSISCIHFLAVFLDVYICYVRLFGAGGQGLPFMAWLQVRVHMIKETAKNIGINFEQLVEEREKTQKKKWEKEKKTQLRKQEKRRHPKQEKERKKKENC